MRRPKPRFFCDGVLVVDKPAGPTSHDVVDELRRRFRPAKLGHAGTLDPYATGVLVLAFNQATRLTSLLGAGHKLYQGWLQLGSATDTGDVTGQVVAEAPVPSLSWEQAARALAQLEGERLQAPPPFSAAKHRGKPLYAYARQGVQVKKPARPVLIASAVLLALETDRLEFEILCSKGTYVRALGEDLAAALGSVGHLCSLRRLESRPFTQEEALEAQAVLQLSPGELEQRLIPPSQALARCGLPLVRLDHDRVWELRQGVILPRQVLLAGAAEGFQAQGAFRVHSPEDELVAVLRWLGPGERRPGREYETIRVFPARAKKTERSARAAGGEKL